MNRRQVRVTKEQNAECQRLLKLMGIPVILVSLFISLGVRCVTVLIQSAYVSWFTGSWRSGSSGCRTRSSREGAFLRDDPI